MNLCAASQFTKARKEMLPCLFFSFFKDISIIKKFAKELHAKLIG